MFKSLIEKLKIFREKASTDLKELEVEDEVGDELRAKKVKKVKKTPLEKGGAPPGKEVPSKRETPPSEMGATSGDIPKKAKTPVKKSAGPVTPIRIVKKKELKPARRRKKGFSDEHIELGDAEGGFTSQRIKDKKLETLLWDLELALMESDVALDVVEEIKKYMKRELLGKKIKRRYSIDDVITDALKNSIKRVLATDYIDFDAWVDKHTKPIVLMFVGVNGTGKTTTIAKVVHRLKKRSRTCVIAASDTFRAGAIEQLEKHATRLGVKLIKHKKGSDPAAIAYDSIAHAKARNKDVVMIDTAGRMQTNTNLMDEMKKIKRVAKPDMVIFVGDSLAGNDAVEQAKSFNKAVGIDAAILTKIDADAKGGAALSITHAIGRPIMFVGVGQEYDDLVPFNAKWMSDRLFGDAAS